MLIMYYRFNLMWDPSDSKSISLNDILFAGRLRPAAQSDKREVPANIRRPDYADHPEGYPLSEMKLKV